MSSPARLIRKYQIKVKPRLGQNFLTSSALASRILDYAQITAEDAVVEIGAGLGALTLPLALRAKRVLALERDPLLVDVLHKEVPLPKSVQIVLADALQFSYRKLAQEWGTKIKIVGNLPYAISTPLIFKLLEEKEGISSMTLMFQKEVGLRLVAAAGTKDYGPLTVACQFLAQVSLLRHVAARYFYPRPKVDSALVSITPLDRPRVRVKNEGTFFQVVKGAFAHRRKTLENSLFASRLFPLTLEELKTILVKLRWNRRRGETLKLEEFATLSNEIEALVSGRKE